MAFVPELDDPNKEAADADSSDLAQQTQSNISTPAPQAGGMAVGGGTAAPTQQKASGSFQDFSKFKQANKGKLDALSNIAIDSAKGGLDKASKAFQDAGSAYNQKVKDNQVDFNVPKLGDNYDVDTYTKKFQAADTKVDTGKLAGELAGSKEFTDYSTAEGLAGNLPGRAGTAAALAGYGNKEGGYSSSAANQDSLLLQSMGGYRTAANQLAKGVKGGAEKALTESQGKIAAEGDTVYKNNQDAKTKALGGLLDNRGVIEQDLDTRARAKEVDRLSDNSFSKKGLSQKIIDAATDQVRARVAVFQAKPKPTPPNPNADIIERARNPDAAANYARDLASWEAEKAEVLRLTNMTPEQKLKEFGGEEALAGVGSSGSITSDNIYRDDPKAQAQLSALEQILAAGQGSGYQAGKTYNAGVLDPTAINTTGVEALLEKLRAGTPAIPKKTAPAVNYPAPVAPAGSPVYDYMGDWLSGNLPTPGAPAAVPQPPPRSAPSNGSVKDNRPQIRKRIDVGY